MRDLYVRMEEERGGLCGVSREAHFPSFLANLLKRALGETMRCVSPDLFSSEEEEEPLDPWDKILLSDSSLTAVHEALAFGTAMTSTLDLENSSPLLLRGLLEEEGDLLVLELLVLLDIPYGMVSIHAFLIMLSKDNIKGPTFRARFLQICHDHCDEDLGGRQGRLNLILDHILKALVVSAYSSSGGKGGPALETLASWSSDILLSLTQTTLKGQGPSVLQKISALKLPNSIKVSYFSTQLTHILTSNDEGEKRYSLEEVIQYQETLAATSPGEGEGLSACIKTFMGSPIMGPSDILLSLSSALRNSKGHRNWGRILHLVKTWIQSPSSSYGAASCLKEVVRVLIREGVTSQSVEKVSLGFILARHLSLISPSPKVWPRYEVWWGSVAFDEHHSPARDGDSFKFLSDLLSEWIPFEPRIFLQVQATFWPFIPSPEAREVWATYVSLAKVRITEVREVEEALEVLEPASSNNPVLADVEAAVRTYETSRTIPQSVGQMWMFRKQYYLESFLPTLLKPPGQPGGVGGSLLSASDARLRLVEALNQKDRIPKELYNAYKKQESSKR